MDRKVSSKANAKPKAPVISVAQELHVDVDIRRLIEACAQLGEVVGHFVKRLKGELTRVKEGDQNGVPQTPLFLYEKIAYRDAKLLFGVVLPPYPYLRVIQLHHCDLGDDGTLLLVDFINGYKYPPDRNPFGIECLELPGCSIGPRGADHLGKLLIENAMVTRLVLDFNRLGDDGTKALCDGLRWNGTLRYLSLAYCSVSANGARWVASRVIRGSNVQTLSLRGNPLHGEGVRELALALGVGMCLESLDLADTGFGTSMQAIECLCEGMERSTSLTSVDLDLNTLAPAGPAAILAVLRKNTRLTFVALGERTSSDTYAEIMKALAQNQKKIKKKKKGTTKP